MLMRLYAESGQVSTALRQFQQCTQVLRRELDVEPETETLELYERIRTRRIGPASVAALSGQNHAHEAELDVKRTPSTSASDTEMRGAETSASLTPARAHNLPVSLSRFIGRNEDRRAVADLMARARHVTLTGPGGIGKTRLALELAGAQARHDEVRLVELAPLTDPLQVPAAVAAVLGVADAAGGTMTETLVRALRGRQMLLVLDTCEHVIEGAAAVARALLEGCPQVRILATSREPLGLAAELLWPMQPLGLPEVSDGEVERIAGAEAVELLVDRARLLRPSFTLGPANAREVAEICRKLDGMPLALELAAARLRVLSPRQVLDRLSARLQLLTEGGRGAPSRQRTVRATIEWSYHLLSVVEQSLFQQLAVFAGGWTLEAAETVCQTEPGGDVLDLLASLVDKSLVVVDLRHEQPRYRLLDTIREYAFEQLEESGRAPDVRTRHQAWCFDLLRDSALVLYGPDQNIRMRQLDFEIDNIRTALDWCAVDAPSLAAALQDCAFPLYRYWEIRASITEAQRRFEALIALAPAVDTEVGVAQSYAFLAYFQMLAGAREQALARVRSAEYLARASGNLTARFNTVLMSTIIHGLMRELGRIPDLCAEGQELSRALDHPFRNAPWTFWLGEAACQQGQLAEGSGSSRRRVPFSRPSAIFVRPRRLPRSLVEWHSSAATWSVLVTCIGSPFVNGSRRATPRLSPPCWTDWHGLRPPRAMRSSRRCSSERLRPRLNPTALPSSQFGRRTVSAQPPRPAPR